MNTNKLVDLIEDKIDMLELATDRLVFEGKLDFILNTEWHPIAKLKLLSIEIEEKFLNQ